ncbi:NADPH-dependent FMN reductase [Ammonicoccus fulvus]|uniref:NADPH-dependent FMN reductase n=1 Tax=Ammonicoccus fulvus TaxID=3138240 RepID=A0ABZ3FTP3_9ACTN
MSSSYRVGVFIGSLSSKSINRKLAQALMKMGAEGVEFVEIPIKDLPLYNHDFDADYPAEGKALKDAIASVQAVLFVSPEYNRSIPGALKNAIDWASRPWGQNSFDHKPAAIIGASIGAIGTAVAQQSLRAVMAFCNARLLTSPEAYIHFTDGLVDDDGNVTNEGTKEFLQNFMEEFHEHTQRVLTVLPQD